MTDPDEAERLRSELTSALATSDRRRGEVDAMAKKLEASESALADANRRAKDARTLAITELRELFLLPHDFAPGDLRDKWRSASEADRERLFMRATMDVSALHTAIWTVTQEARDEAKAAGSAIMALAGERDAALASLRNAKANVRDLQAQLELMTSQCAELVEAETRRVEAVVSAARELVMPRHDGELIHCCRHNANPNGSSASARCRNPRTYRDHCDEHRDEFEYQEAIEAPLIRAVEFYDLSKASESLSYVGARRAEP